MTPVTVKVRLSTELPPVTGRVSSAMGVLTVPLTARDVVVLRPFTVVAVPAGAATPPTELAVFASVTLLNTTVRAPAVAGLAAFDKVTPSTNASACASVKPAGL